MEDRGAAGKYGASHALETTWVEVFVFFFQAEDGIRDVAVTGVQTCALPILTVSGGVAISRRPCRTRTGPITSVPGRWVLSRTSRVMVRTGPPTPSSVTSVKIGRASCRERV